MAYVDGFVIAVPHTRREQFIEHARKIDAVFIEHGALRVVECWGDDVKPGRQTDFRRAVEATDDETVAFSWVEWPDKATRDAAMKRVETLMQSDPRLNPASNPMPFDGRRMIFGGFEPVVDLGADGASS